MRTILEMEESEELHFLQGDNGREDKKWIKEKTMKERRKRTRSVGGASCFASNAIVDCLLSCVVRIDVVEC